MKKITMIYVMLIFVVCINAAKAQTDMYKQYCHLEDVTVACIMNLPIDTIRVEVTILEPKTKEAVYYLVEEFNLGIEKETIEKELEDKKRGLVIRGVYRNDVKKIYKSITCLDDYKDKSILVYNCNTGGIILFHNIETKERNSKINSFLMKALANPELLPTMIKIQ